MQPLLMSRDQLLFVLFILLPRLSFLFQLYPAVFIEFCAVQKRTYLWVECSQALQKGRGNALTRGIYHNSVTQQNFLSIKHTQKLAVLRQYVKLVLHQFSSHNDFHQPRRIQDVSIWSTFDHSQHVLNSQGFIKGQAVGKLTGCEADFSCLVCTSGPGCSKPD